MGAEKCGYTKTALVKKSRPNGKRRKMFVERLLKKSCLDSGVSIPMVQKRVDLSAPHGENAPLRWKSAKREKRGQMGRAQAL